VVCGVRVERCRKKIILFELNEVPLKIINFFIKARPQSALAKIFPRATVYETYTEDGGHLSPWVTWPTLHRGVSNHKHCISDFGQPLDEVDQEFPPIWKLLANNGVRTGVGGSLHSYVPQQSFSEYAFYLPDIFAKEPTCWPKHLEGFQAFCLGMARESAKNVSDKVPLSQALDVLLNIRSIGLRPGTLVDIARQLVEERFQSWKLVRRRTYQSVLAFDVFFKQLETSRPDFSTYFTNHVASAMHRYWQASFPEDYAEVTFDEAWLQTYHGEIIYAMQKADLMLRRLMEFVNRNPDFRLVIASSMGQQAVESRPTETLLYVTEPEQFMQSLGLRREDWELRPAMFPQLNVRIADEQKRAAFEQIAKTLEINGAPVHSRAASDGFFSLDFGHENVSEIIVKINGQLKSSSETGINNVVIQDKVGVTAYHIPQGSMLIYDGKTAPKGGITQVSTSDVAPAILQNFGINAPGYMNKPTALLA